MKIPLKGYDKSIIFENMDRFSAGDLPWKSGKTWGHVFVAGREAQAVGQEAFLKFMTQNGLDFSIYPSLLRFETELVAMLADHLNGDEQVVGNFTSGGTESILLAVKTARDYFRTARPEITSPEMVIPETAHAAFHKAAQYFNLKLIQVPVDPKTFHADVDLMAKAITPNTILLVASAPSYAHGVVDPIEQIGRLALDNGLLLHVDGCVGGLMLPYFRRLGADFPDFDFSVPGVSSISVDLHKYGYTPKGASLVLYRNRQIRKHQIFTCASWPGYTMVNSAIQSSKSGGPLAAAWAVVNFLGDDGFLELARLKYEATRRLKEGINQIEGLQVMAEPDLCMLAFTSAKADVFQLSQQMKEKGWHIQPQFRFGSSAANIHLTVLASNAHMVEPFLAELAEAVHAAKGMEKGPMAAMILEVLAGLDLETLSDEELNKFMAAGEGGLDVSQMSMVEINQVLNELPPPLRDVLLAEHVNDMFVYRENAPGAFPF